MKRFAIVFLFLALFPFLAHAESNRWSQLERKILSLMKDGEVPGLSIAVIENSKVTFHAAYGVKNVETGENVDETTIFEAASLSKPVVAYAAIKLVESGRLNLDEPLAHYLPEPYIDGDQRISLITARSVLKHSTGFPNWRPEGQPLKIFFNPDSRFSYSGEGFVYLQKAIEQITGKPLNTFLSESVFEPLGMRNSSYVWKPEYEKRKAAGHDSTGNVKTIRKPVEANAAASLHTTAMDYAQFVIAILGSSGAFQEMLKPQIRVLEGCKECLDVSPDKNFSDSIFWSLGWALEKRDGRFSFWHWGDNNGEFHAFVSASPHQKHGIVILTNSGNGLSILPELDAEIFDENQPAFAWIGIEPYNSPLKNFYKNILVEGKQAIARADWKQFNESQLNRLGYWLMGRKKMQEAIAIFHRNVERFPDSWNAYDSLAESYLVLGDRESSARYYQKSLDLNPNNTNAVEKLKSITASN